MHRKLSKAGVATLCGAACLFATAGTAQAANDEHWLDVEGQIQYAYYTEDLRALGRQG